MSDPSQARLLRALVRSAAADRPAPGARARARARLGIANTCAPALGVAAAALIAVLIATSGGPSGSAASPALTLGGVGTPAGLGRDCPGGLETPPSSCTGPGLDGARLPSSVDATGSSSGTGLSRGSSGG